MNEYEVLSDQLECWSEQDAESIDVITAAAAQSPAAQIAEPSADPEGLPDRALQALREAGMQVREGLRPRTQVLPVHQPDRPEATNGLRTPGLSRPGGRVLGQPPSGAGDHRRDLTDQPGTPTPQRELVGTRHGCRGHGTGHRVCRHPPDLHFGGQHAHRTAPRRFGSQADTGGQP